MKLSTLIYALAATVLTAGAACADDYVNGYTRRDGTYVQPHHRTSPDGNPYNNYSAQGNSNPYTGQAGTVNPNNHYGQGGSGLYSP